MGFFTKGNSGGLLDDRRKDVKAFKKVIKIATIFHRNNKRRGELSLRLLAKTFWE